MAIFAGFWSRGKAIVARVVSRAKAGVNRVVSFVTGQPVTRGSVTPTPKEGRTETPIDQRKELLETGRVETPTGVSFIDESKQDQTIAGKIPQQWLDELDWKDPKITGKSSIFGEPFHYQIEFKILVRNEDDQGNVFFTSHTDYYTVTSEGELSREQVIARGLELAEIDYNTEDPYFGGSVIGIGEVQPVHYTA